MFNKPHCVSRISTTPKKDESLRFITDLQQVNSYLTNSKKLVYENIDTVLNIIEPEDKLITLDIKDRFFNVKVDPEFHKYLGFSFRNKYYVWCVLPFGLKHSPYYFCKILRPVVQYLRQCGLRTLPYVDDFILADKQDKIEFSKNLLITTLKRLGYNINFIKSVLTPNYSAEYIGYVIITNKGNETVWLCIPRQRIKKVQSDIKRTLKSGFIIARAMCKVLFPAKLLLRNVYRLLSKKTSWQQK